MSWLGYCTRCGEPTPSTKDPSFWPSEATTPEESGYLFSQKVHISYDQDGQSYGCHHQSCDNLPERFGPGGREHSPYPGGSCTRDVPPARKTGASRKAVSPIERQFWNACQRLGVPALDGLIREHSVAGYRIDFALPDRKIGIELDGFATHSSTADIEKDRRRQRNLEGRGWYIIRFGGREVHHDADYCAQQAAWLIEHARRGD